MLYSTDGVINNVVVNFENLDAVFLDLDDTLVDYRNSCIVGLARVKSLVPCLSRVDVGTLEKEFREILRDNLPALFDGKMTVEQERTMRMSEILKRHGVPTEPETVSRCDSEFFDGFWNTRSVMDGADSILQRCRDLGIPVVIITNGNNEMQKRTIDMLDLNQYIDHLLTPETSMELKPNPGLFEKALSLTGADRRKTVMIGDTWQHDVLGALNAGITPVWINRRGIQKPTEHNALEIRSLRELLAMSQER